jgi:hypothetical protein
MEYMSFYFCEHGIYVCTHLMRQLKVVIMAHTESLHKHHMEVAKGMSAHIFSHVSTRLFRLSLQELFPFLVQ